MQVIASRPPFHDFAESLETNLLEGAGPAERPWFDQQLLAAAGLKNPWPDNKDFALCVTHDVDATFSSLLALRTRRDFLRAKRYSLLRKWLHGRRMKRALGRRDPLWRFEDWLDLEEASGFRSTFFFFPPYVRRRDPRDCDYFLDDPFSFRGRAGCVRDFMRYLAENGWEVGLHASIHAARDGEMLVEQKRAVEAALGRNVESVRFHYLSFDVENTPGLLETAGFRNDSSIGFNRRLGFRSGTCFPYRLGRGDEVGSVLEIPLIVQDTAIVPEECLDASLIDGFMTRIIGVMETVREVRGCLTILFHPDRIGKPVFSTVYKLTLEEARRRNAWGTTVASIAEHWRKSGYQDVRSLCS